MRKMILPAMMLFILAIYSGCGNDSQTNNETGQDSLSTGNTGNTGENTGLTEVENNTEEIPSESVVKQRGFLTEAEYTKMVGFDVEGYDWMESYKNKGETPGVFMITGMYLQKKELGNEIVDVIFEGCDDDLCRSPGMTLFKKRNEGMHGKSKFWEEEAGGKKLYFYSTDEAEGENHTVTVSGNLFTRLSKFQGKIMKVRVKGNEVDAKINEMKGHILNVLGNVPA